ncbi:MAG TPA: TlpA disulfide reductase family protein [Streptosporangiaceae bacterium]|jgi:thiol-disulfide isomerase/thioredoxin|nr:TlpA disulfide reductase family protein [Streptosporangiaceae bacterium]
MARQDTMTAADATEPPTGGTARRLAHRLRGLGAARLTALTAVLAGVVVIVTLSITGTGGGPHQAPPAPAKNFSLGALGHPAHRITLSSLAGRPVIVNFFASWCTPCQKETPMLARFAKHTNVAVIGIDVNDPTSSALAFVHKTGVTYPVATESAMGSTVVDYNLPGLPATFFLDSRHRIVKRVYGAVTQAELTSGTALVSERAK